MANRIWRARWKTHLLLFIFAVGLAGCGSRLPSEVESMVLSSFDPDEQPRIHAATQVEPLAEDTAAGAQEVWCVDITFRCFTSLYYGRGEYSTCGDNRLVRLINGEWQISRVITDEEQDAWTTRGCELMEAVIDLP